MLKYGPTAIVHILHCFFTKSSQDWRVVIHSMNLIQYFLRCFEVNSIEAMWFFMLYVH